MSDDQETEQEASDDEVATINGQPLTDQEDSTDSDGSGLTTLLVVGVLAAAAAALGPDDTTNNGRRGV